MKLQGLTDRPRWRYNEQVFCADIAQCCGAQHTGQKFTVSQRSDDEPSRPSPSAPAANASRTVATENRVRDIVGINIALGQMFEAGGGEK
jgi:hypothetical protein